MYYQGQSLVEPDYWYLQKHEDWVIFPWENKE